MKNYILNLLDELKAESSLDNTTQLRDKLYLNKKAWITYPELRYLRLLHELCHFVLAEDPTAPNLGLKSGPFTVAAFIHEGRVLGLQASLQAALNEPLDLNLSIPNNERLLQEAIKRESATKTSFMQYVRLWPEDPQNLQEFSIKAKTIVQNHIGQ